MKTDTRGRRGWLLLAAVAMLAGTVGLAQVGGINERATDESDGGGRGQIEQAQADAQAEERRAEADALGTLVAYDIRDLLVDIPNFTDAPHFEFFDEEAGGSFGGAGLYFPDPNGFDDDEDEGRTREEMFEGIRELIMETVDPDSWRENGGAVGAIRHRDGTLYVSQTAANHTAVAAALAQIRANQPKTVRLRAHWVLTHRAALEPFLKAVTALPARGQVPDGGAGAGTPPAAGGRAILVIEPADLERLGEGVVHYRAETLCFGDQRVYLRGTRRESLPGAPGAIAVAVRPAPSPTPAPATWPAASQPSRPVRRGPANGFDTGIVLDIATTINSDTGTAILTFTSQVVDVAGNRAASAMAASPDAPGGSPATLPPPPGSAVPPARPDVSQPSRVRLVVSEMKTSARIPLGKMVLIGGMTDPSDEIADRPQLYLFIEVASD